VSDNLPETLRQGLFDCPAQYAAVIRFSTNPGDLLDDAVSVPRGMAVKVIGVVGPRLDNSEGERTQDFLMASGPAFGASTPKSFLRMLRTLSKTTDRFGGAKVLLSSILQPLEAQLRSFWPGGTVLGRFGGSPRHHPLGQSYFSQTAYLYGPYMAKFSAVPTSSALRELVGGTVRNCRGATALRHAVGSVLAAHGGEWEFRVQLCNNLDDMPIEDATAVWDEARSPFVTVGRLTAPPQPGWGEWAKRMDRDLAFNPWHGLTVHRPLGGVNRSRKGTYRGSAEFRAGVNGCPILHPAAASELD
jgi:hypothetical protein